MGTACGKTIHTCTQTHTDRHTQTDTHRHTDTQTHIHTHTDTHEEIVDALAVHRNVCHHHVVDGSLRNVPTIRQINAPQEKTGCCHVQQALVRNIDAPIEPRDLKLLTAS